MLVLSVHFLLGAVYIYNHVPFNAPDEPAHMAHVAYIAENRALPVVPPPDPARRVFEPWHGYQTYEFFQPPLYYALAAPVYHVAMKSQFPAQVYALRWQNLLFSLLNIWLIFMFSARAAGGTAGIIAAAFAALLPQYIFISTSVSNDTLANLFSTAILVLGVAGISGRFSIKGKIIEGLMWGLGLMAKLTVAGPALAVAAVSARSCAKKPGRILSCIGIPFAAAALLSAWYFMRNISLYGDIAGYGSVRSYDSGMALREFPSWVLLLFESFWGKFAWMASPLPSAAYAALALFTASVAAGFFLWASRNRRRLKEPGWLVSFASVALAFAFTFYYGFLLTRQPQGRYLFPALAPISLAFAAGMHYIWTRIPARMRFAAAAVCVSGVICLQWLSIRAL